MECRAVVPDGDIALGPAEPYLGIVVLRQKVEEISQKDIALVLCDAVDTLGKPSVDKNRSPTCYGVRPDDGVDGSQVIALVERRTTLCFSKGVA